MTTATDRVALSQRIVDALDDNLPIHANIASLAFVFCQTAQLAGMNKDRVLASLDATWDIVALQRALQPIN